MKYTIALLAATSVFCTSDSGPPVVPQRRIVQQPITSSVDVISSAHCSLSSGRLVSCSIPTTPLEGFLMDTAVPLRTRIQSNVLGNCSTQYPLELSLEMEGEAPLSIPYLQGKTHFLRSHSGEAIASATLKDSSAWTVHAAFDASCRVALAMAWNEVDVDTKPDAEVIVQQLGAIVAQKVSVRDRYGELLMYQKAFAFMRAIAANFHSELSNEEIQALRSAAIEADPAIVNFILNCGTPDITDEDRARLQTLHSKLYILGDPAQWQRPDGGTKTLADFFGQEAAAIIATLEAIAAKQQEGELPKYEELYVQAQLEVTLAEQKLNLAKSQLAHLLEQ